MLMSESARIVDIFARTPVSEKSSGPITLIHDHPLLVLSDCNCIEEGQTIEKSSSVLLIEKKLLSKM